MEELITSVTFPHSVLTIITVGDFVIFKDTISNLNYIYKFENNNFHSFGSFPGNIGHYITGYKPTDFFINQTDLTWEFRDIKDPNKILFTRSTQLHNNSLLYHISKNYITFSGDDGNYIYGFDDDFSNFKQTFSEQSDIYGIMLAGSTFYNNHLFTRTYRYDYYERIYTFYAIENGIPRKIGNLNSLHDINFAYIFPVEKKIVTIDDNSFYIYDFNSLLTD